MSDKVDEFNSYRSKMNKKILNENSKVLKRIFNLDSNAFKAGALDGKTKELLGKISTDVTTQQTILSFSIFKDGIPQNPSSWIYKM